MRYFWNLLKFVPANNYSLIKCFYSVMSLTLINLRFLYKPLGTLSEHRNNEYSASPILNSRKVAKHLQRCTLYYLGFILCLKLSGWVVQSHIPIRNKIGHKKWYVFSDAIIIYCDRLLVRYPLSSISCWGYQCWCSLASMLILWFSYS